MHPWRDRFKVMLLALAILLYSLTPYPRAYTEMMRQAENHRAVGEYGAALDAYQQATRIERESPLPWLRGGQVLLRQHRFAEATNAFYEAERFGGGSDSLLGLGESFAGGGDWAAALRAWLRAQVQAPDDARIYVSLGRGSVAQGRFEQASEYLMQALELDPPPDQARRAHALLGWLLIDDDPVQAADHLRQAGEEEMQAVVQTAGAEHDVAQRAQLLGAAFLRRGELTLARYHFERSTTWAPANPEAHAYLAHTLDQLGETVAARALLEKALALDPDATLAYYFLGTHHRLVGNVEAAQAALWEAILRDPENAALRVEMAEAFLDLSNYAQAEEWYQGAVEVASDDVDFHLLLAAFYLRHLYRVAEGGLPAAQAAVALAPGDARAHDLLGWAYHLTGRPIEAQQALSQALALAPDLVSAHYHLGSLYATSGQRELARRHLQRAADLDTGGYYRSRAEAVLRDLG
jgi:Flp pilus assembly protein TadD